MYYTCKYASPLGGMTLASDGKNLTGLWITAFLLKLREILRSRMCGYKGIVSEAKSMESIKGGSQQK